MGLGPSEQGCSMKGVRKLWEGLSSPGVLFNGWIIQCFQRLHFSLAISPKCHGWGHRKNYQALLFFLMPRWGREWKLVAKNETFLMLSLAMKNGWL